MLREVINNTIDGRPHSNAPLEVLLAYCETMGVGRSKIDEARQNTEQHPKAQLLEHQLRATFRFLFVNRDTMPTGEEIKAELQNILEPNENHDQRVHELPSLSAVNT